MFGDSVELRKKLTKMRPPEPPPPPFIPSPPLTDEIAFPAK